MGDLEQARLMFRMAYKDYKALRGMNDREVFEDEIFGFHVQQATEKALKAWLLMTLGEHPWNHDLRLLVNLLQNQGLDMEEYVDLLEYNAYAVQFRYESLVGFYEEDDRNDTADRVKSLLDQVEQKLKETASL